MSAGRLSPPEPGSGPAIGAVGHPGQYIHVFPELDLVRFGRKPGGVSWPAVFRAIARALHADDTEIADG